MQFTYQIALRAFPSQFTIILLLYYQCGFRKQASHICQQKKPSAWFCFYYINNKKEADMGLVLFIQLFHYKPSSNCPTLFSPTSQHKQVEKHPQRSVFISVMIVLFLIWPSSYVTFCRILLFSVFILHVHHCVSSY